MKPGSGLVIHPGLIIYRNDDGVLCEKSDLSVHINQSCLQLHLNNSSGSAWFGNLTIDWRIEVCSQNQWPSMVTPQKAAVERGMGQPSSPKRGVEVFDAESVGRNVDLRFWQPGDRFRPIGLPGQAKLQDLFVNARIPRHLRHQVVLACNSHGEVFWVQGLRIGECCKVTKTTRQILEWRWDGTPA
jgi:tRNA(Ile)-lysidine synthetase-like protein